jgi:hypothetical protein
MKTASARPSLHRPGRSRISKLWQEHVRNAPGFPRLLIAISFLVAFGIVRLITHGIRHGWLPIGDVGSSNPEGQGWHIHHYIWGIGIVLLLAYIQIGFQPKRGRNLCAVLYGIALALILDEFALLLNLSDVYWSGRGRESLVAIAIAAGFVTIAVLIGPFVRAVLREMRGR